jgi:hypothetical protein
MLTGGLGSIVSQAHEASPRIIGGSLWHSTSPGRSPDSSLFGRLALRHASCWGDGMALRLRLVGSVAPVVLAGLSMVGCGGSVDRSGATNAGEVRAPWCPSTVPEEGAPCTSTLLSTPDGAPPLYGVSAVCEYGDDPHCTAVASCGYTQGYKGTTWGVTPPDPSCGGNAATCPSAFPAKGSGCAANASCTYPSGRCSCSVRQYSICGNPCGDEDGGTEWSCRGWEQQPSGCPEPRPLLGTSCSVPLQFCGGYPDPVMMCADGYWVVPQMGGC